MGKLVLGYWNIHGLASPIRFLLELAGAEYEEELYTIEKKDEWFEGKKESLGLLYPNLPYIVDGDVKMTEHLAIMRYIARKYNLAPTTEQEIIVSDQTESFVFDIRFRFYRTAYNTDNYEASKVEFLELANKKLPYLNNLLANNEYVVGDRLTYVDVVVYDFLLLMRAFEPELISKNANLARFIDTIQKLPKMNDYMNSNRWVKRTFCAPFATFKGSM